MVGKLLLLSYHIFDFDYYSLIVLPVLRVELHKYYITNYIAALHSLVEVDKIVKMVMTWDTNIITDIFKMGRTVSHIITWIFSQIIPMFNVCS